MRRIHVCAPNILQTLMRRRALYTHSGRSNVPEVQNEPVLSYLADSQERISLTHAIKELRSTITEVPLVIGNTELRTGDTGDIRIPHEHHHLLGRYHKAGSKEVTMAIETALRARKIWVGMGFEHRAAIFLRAAHMLSTTHRQLLNAATVLNQSKNFYQAEIDSACELIDFLRFNCHYAQRIYEEQPRSPFGYGVWNRVSYRPLEGFVLAITPFNFTAIAGNLISAPALMGNVVVWKPSDHAMLSAHYILKLFREAGLPDGVINLVAGDAETVANTALSHPQFAGLHFTGSSAVFRRLWAAVGAGVGEGRYVSFPRLVGETGGKDFVVVHRSADPHAVATALVRGAFEYSGQKCSAASRAYIPRSLWNAERSGISLRKELVEQMRKVVMGNPEDVRTMVGAVIHKHAFDKISGYFQYARSNSDKIEILIGGHSDSRVGWFIEPTVVVCKDPRDRLMSEEIFGPVLALYVYDDSDEEAFTDVLRLVDETTHYALTGSVFARDRLAIEKAERALENAAGNFYINDKPTGAVVGQQPFGGSRASGTNDKAGSMLNLLRWVSPKAVKETFVPPREPLYPYMSST